MNGKKLPLLPLGAARPEPRLESRAGAAGASLDMAEGKPKEEGEVASTDAPDTGGKKHPLEHSWTLWCVRRHCTMLQIMCYEHAACSLLVSMCVHDGSKQRVCVIC